MLGFRCAASPSLFAAVLALLCFPASAQTTDLTVEGIKPGDTYAKFLEFATDRHCNVLPNSYFVRQLPDGRRFEYFTGTECPASGAITAEEYVSMQGSPEKGGLIYFVGHSRMFADDHQPPLDQYILEFGKIYGKPEGVYKDDRGRDAGYYWRRPQPGTEPPPFNECQIMPGTVPDQNYLFRPECGTILTLGLERSATDPEKLRRFSLQLFDYTLASTLHFAD
ncbi:MAG: hypothetical protein LBR29_02050 [Methylobacteriaceae bacterium]|jgi:hypothetical protein|nr:hypothetical protein [Methylobacteriaceae bacterium]